MSAAVTVPTPPPALVTIAGDIHPDDLIKPLELGARLQASTDGGATWTEFAAFGWRGAAGTTQQPLVRLPGSLFAAGHRVRVELTIPSPLRVGATITAA